MQPAPAASATLIEDLQTGWRSLEARSGYTIRYLVLGRGPRTWVAFHGFGQSPEDMTTWAEPLLAQGNCRILLPELPWHGKSRGPENHGPITEEEWAGLFAQLCRKEQVHTFRLFGFSLGARLALLTACQMKATVEQVVLCAPDGITNSLWFTLGTQTTLGRRIFRRFTDDPAPLFKITHLLHKLGFLNRSLKRFVEKEMTDPIHRELAYRSWQALRLIPPDAGEIAEVANKWKVPVVLFFGRHDRIIPVRRGRPLMLALKHCQVHLLDCGHNALPILAGRLLAALEKNL